MPQPVQSRNHPFRLGLFIFLFTAFSWQTADDVVAQLNSPQLGDIIEYESHANGLAYGLVTKVTSVSVEVEVFEGPGRFDTDQLSGFESWRVVDAFKKKPNRTSRIWKSSDGKFEMNAKLVRVENDEVRLEKENGKNILVPMSQLSKKDRDYIDRNRGEAASTENPFDRQEVDDFPEAVLQLQARRRELLVDEERHQRLAKLGAQMLPGDIIKYDDFHKGEVYGIVTQFKPFLTVERVGPGGTLEEDVITGMTQWTYFDRHLVVMPLPHRKWQSANGKFSLVARLMKVADGNVSLENRSGKVVEVELAKLSAADKSYVTRSRGKLDVVNDDSLERERENYGPELQRLLARRRDILKLEMANRMAVKDVARMTSIRLANKPIELTPQQLQPIAMGDNSFSLQFQLPVVESARIEQVCYSRQAGLVAFAATSPFHGTPTLAVVDSNAGTVVSNLAEESPGDDGRVIALSPSGQTVLVASEDQLELWKFEDEILSRKSVINYESFRAPKAHLFSDENGVIVNHDGELAFFDVTDRIVPTHKISRSGVMKITQDEQTVLFFVPAESTLYAIDVESKKCVGGVPLESPKAQDKVSGSYFSLNLHQVFFDIGPTGNRALLIAGGKLMVYELPSGKKIKEHVAKNFGLSSFTANSSGFHFLTDNLIVVSSNRIVDLDRGFEIAELEEPRYRGNTTNFSDGSRILAELDSRQMVDSIQNRMLSTASSKGGPRSVRGVLAQKTNVPATIAVQRLPIESIVSHSENLDDALLVRFGPGDAVQLKFRLGQGQGRLENQLRTRIKSVMSAGSVDIADRSDFVLELTYLEHAKVTETFRIMGPEGRTRKESMVPKTMSAKLYFQNEVIWSTSESASFDRLFDEGDLERELNKSRKMKARDLLDIEYPTSLNSIKPSPAQSIFMGVKVRFRRCLCVGF